MRVGCEVHSLFMVQCEDSFICLTPYLYIVDSETCRLAAST